MTGGASALAWISMTASPPMPFMCGSTTCSMNPAATAASNALPPFSRIDMPTCEASQWVDETTPKVPVMTGRVVKIGGSGGGMLERPFGGRGGGRDYQGFRHRAATPGGVACAGPAELTARGPIYSDGAPAGQTHRFRRARAEDATLGTQRASGF